MNTGLLDNWFSEHEFGQYLSQLEKKFFKEKLARIPSQTILQIGMGEWSMIWENHIKRKTFILQDNYLNKYSQILVQDNLLPWKSQSVDLVIWPHGLDKTSATALSEINRILKLGGKLLLTGFNSNGYWRLFYSRNKTLKQYYFYQLKELMTLLNQYNFVLSEGQFLGYALKSRKTQNHNRIELMGNRWWPHLAAIYALVLEKQAIPLKQISLTEETLNLNICTELKYTKLRGN